MTLIPGTFILAAAKRYLASILNPAPSSLHTPDILVGRLLPPHIRFLTWLSARLLRAFPYLQSSLAARFPSCRLGSMTARTKFLDASVESAIAAGADKVVLLAAGLDTRALRQRAILANARVFELDLASTQEYKIRALRRCGLLSDWSATFVHADFASRNWVDALRDAGCDLATGRTHVLWEGCTYYLTAEAVRETLKLLKFPAVTISFDFIDSAIIGCQSVEAPDGAVQTMAIVRYLKEPWQFGIDFQRFHEWVAEQGWEVVDSVRGAEETRFLNGSGTHAAVPHYRPFAFHGLATIRPLSC